MDIQVDDVVRLRKKHPCGGDEWQVVKLGVDIRVKCLKCQRLILLERGTLQRRITALVSRAQSASQAADTQRNG